MKKAGFSDGMYNGPALLTVADNVSPAKETAEAFQEQVKAIGIKLPFREVPHATMLSKFCQVPKSKVAICPNSAGAQDFFSSQSFIDPLFNGANIVPSGNVNTAAGQRSARSTRRSTRRKQVTDPTKANEAWGDLDKDVTNQAYFVTVAVGQQRRACSRTTSTASAACSTRAPATSRSAH